MTAPYPAGLGFPLEATIKDEAAHLLGNSNLVLSKGAK
jgi:hypothetical protein